MTRCAACNRILKAPESIANGMGPGCLRKSMRASAGPDLFAMARAEAIQALQAAADVCLGMGVVVNLSIENAGGEGRCGTAPEETNGG